MPELPEVETLRRQLSHEVAGKKVVRVDVRFGKRISPSGAALMKALAGRRIEAVERRAKLLRLRFDSGLNLLVHLKMTGRLLVRPQGSVPTKHVHAIFHLSDGRELHWEDVRKFGFLKLMDDKKADAYVEGRGYGPEPLERGFSWQKMTACLRTRPNAKIKPLLMEQGCIAGIGNIYAVEALWEAKIHPLSRVKDVVDARMKALHRAVVRILRAAVLARGSSADDYLDLYGRPGAFVPKLKAYGREGKPCRRCGKPLKKMRVGGRGTAYCALCQRQ